MTPRIGPADRSHHRTQRGPSRLRIRARASLIVGACVALGVAASGLRPLAAQNAEQLYTEACDDGDLQSCEILALMYATGRDVARDLTQAAEYFRRACDGGRLTSCTTLGDMFATGSGVAPDVTQAVALYERACDGAEPDACAKLDALMREVASAFVEGLPTEGRTLAAGTERLGRLTPEHTDPSGAHVQAWSLSSTPGEEVTVDLISSDFDAFLILTGPGLDGALRDDDGGGRCNARITFTAQGERYRVVVTSANPDQTGSYVLRAGRSVPAPAPGPCRRRLERQAERLPPSVEASLYRAVVDWASTEGSVLGIGADRTICVEAGDRGDDWVRSEVVEPIRGGTPLSAFLDGAGGSSSPPVPPEVVAAGACERSVDTGTGLPSVLGPSGEPAALLAMAATSSRLQREVAILLSRNGVEPRSLRCRVDAHGPRVTAPLVRVSAAGAGDRDPRAGGPRRPPSAEGEWNGATVRWRISGC